MAPEAEKAAKTMNALVRSFLKDESGATAIEYGLIACGIALAIITAINLLGLSLLDIFTKLTNMLGG